MRSSIRFGALAAFALAGVSSVSSAALYSQNFEVDDTANWSVKQTDANSAANLFFNYVDNIGIPAAPHSAPGDKYGIKLEADIPGGVASTTGGSLSVSPIGQHFTGSYRVQFDAWMNVNGPFPAGGNGSTQETLVAIGARETTAQSPYTNIDGVAFSTSGDGGTGTDYRVYTASGAPVAETSGVYAAGNVAGVSNNSNAYYANVGGHSAPAAQLALFSQQSGTVATGALGMAWYTWTVTKDGNIVTWTVQNPTRNGGNPLTIATIDVSSKTFLGDNIAFGQFDINNTKSSDPNVRSLLFGLIDNVTVEAIPEPATASLLGAASLSLLARRRTR